MRHAKPYRKLSRQRSHYRALMRNLAAALFEHERIETTVIKAKEVRRFVDKIITLGKGGSLHDRRRAFGLMGNITLGSKEGRVDIVGKVFDDIAKRMDKHPGGYTRIIKLANRSGDAAPMCILELVERAATEKASGDKETKAEKKTKPKAPKADKKTTTKKKAAEAA